MRNKQFEKIMALKLYSQSWRQTFKENPKVSFHLVAKLKMGSGHAEHGFYNTDLNPANNKVNPLKKQIIPTTVCKESTVNFG